MESEDAALIRRFIGAANDGDLEFVRRAYHPDVVLVAHPSGAVDAGTVTGRREVLRWFGDWFGPGGMFEGWRTDIVELWEPDQGVVLTRAHSSGRGRESGLELEGDALHNAYVVEAGLIVRLSVAGTADEALAGIGRADLAGTVDGPPPNEGASQ